MTPIYPIVLMNLLFFSVFNIILQVSVFYQHENVWAFNIILGMTMKTVAFES